MRLMSAMAGLKLEGILKWRGLDWSTVLMFITDMVHVPVGWKTAAASLFCNSLDFGSHFVTGKAIGTDHVFLHKKIFLHLSCILNHRIKYCLFLINIKCKSKCCHFDIINFIYLELSQ